MNSRYRWVGLFSIDEPLRCPNGHRFATHDVWSDDKDLHCNHRGRNGREDCGVSLWLIGGALRLRGKALVIVCEVTGKELEYLKTTKLDASEVMRYLGFRPGLEESA